MTRQKCVVLIGSVFKKKNKSEVSNQLDNHRSNVLQNSGANAANAEHQEKLNNSTQNFRHPHGDFFPWQEQVAYGPSNILVSLGAGTHATNADAVEDWYLKVAGKAFTRL